MLFLLTQKTNYSVKTSKQAEAKFSFVRVRIPIDFSEKLMSDSIYEFSYQKMNYYTYIDLPFELTPCALNLRRSTLL